MRSFLQTDSPLVVVTRYSWCLFIDRTTVLSESVRVIVDRYLEVFVVKSYLFLSVFGGAE